MLTDTEKVELIQLEEKIREVENRYPQFGDIPAEHDYWKWKNRVRFLKLEK